MELAITGIFPISYGDGVVAGNQWIIAVLIENLPAFLREEVVLVSVFIVERVRQEFETVNREAEIRVI